MANVFSAVQCKMYTATVSEVKVFTVVPERVEQQTVGTFGEMVCVERARVDLGEFHSRLTLFLSPSLGFHYGVC